MVVTKDLRKLVIIRCNLCRYESRGDMIEKRSWVCYYILPSMLIPKRLIHPAYHFNKRPGAPSMSVSGMERE